MEKSLEDDDAFEPLECVALPVRILAHDVEVGGPATVRLFFRGPGGARLEPGGELSEVTLVEAPDRVTVALLRRSLQGDAPDDVSYGGERMIRGRPFSLDIGLREPLDGRPLIDASTGDAVPRQERTTADPLPGEVQGTPRWIPTEG